jgi:D-glycero-alpha-D-manno-heptose-7-phosphate kinase
VRVALGKRLLLVYLGRTHSSTAIHEEVIRSLDGADPAGSAALEDLRRAAAAARDAVEAGDLAALGAAMQSNTEGQRRLHASLVGADAQRVIAAVAARGALGWKVNGAGGEGGSLAVLCPPEEAARAAIEAAIAQASSDCRVLPTSIATAGLNIAIGESSGGEAWA